VACRRRGDDHQTGKELLVTDSSLVVDASTGTSEERIGTVDVWQLHHYRAPIQRIFARHAVHHLELNHYLGELLATKRWDVVRATPHPSDDGSLSDHVYDIYGRSWGRT
jgi:hypothetical protein